MDLDVAVPQPAPADTKILTAAVLVFGTKPVDVVPGASVQLIRRTGVGPGPGPTEARVEISGPIPLLLDDCLDFIKRHTRVYEIVLGRRRMTLPEYPEEVLREALLNALAHRDYNVRGTTVDGRSG